MQKMLISATIIAGAFALNALAKPLAKPLEDMTPEEMVSACIADQPPGTPDDQARSACTCMIEAIGGDIPAVSVVRDAHQPGGDLKNVPAEVLGRIAHCMPKKPS